jgi:sodium/proline symporter
MIAATFLASLAVFASIGLLSMRRKQPTTEDYLVAGREVAPWLTALSSVATNNSGFMFIGLIGFTYRFGVQAIWLQLGWVLGDLAAWLWVHRPVREVSADVGASSVPALLGTAADGKRVTSTTVLAAILTIVFLGGYAAAQLRAGSAAMESLFGWQPHVGAVLGAAIVLLYSFAGGLRASIWTDAAQSVVMLGSMAILMIACGMQSVPPWELLSRLRSIDPALAQWIPDDLSFGFALYLLGFVFGGLGAIGQPHILIRSMSIRSAEEIGAARRVYFAWFVPFNVVAVGAGMYARVMLPELVDGLGPAAAGVAAESALPDLAQRALPDALVGLMLAGLFAATMSTADSQILSCSAALTQDIAPRWRDSYKASKLGTLLVTLFALAIALLASDNVFGLVLGAWSSLGATLGPLLLLRIAGVVPPPGVAAAMMLSGLATVWAWDASPWSGHVFKLLPGMAVPAAVYLAYTLARSLRLSASAADRAEKSRTGNREPETE